MKYLATIMIVMMMGMSIPASAQLPVQEQDTIGRLPPAGPMPSPSERLPVTNSRFHESPQYQDARYRECTESSDCAMFTLVCGAPLPVNRIFVPDFEAWNNAQSTRYSCSVNKSNPSNIAACLGGYCTITAATTQPRYRNSDPKFCYSNAECGVVADACGKKIAVNMSHMAARLEQEAENAECTSWTDNRTPQEVRCQHNQCTVLFGRAPE
ncbi:MAG: hypothetical protein PSY14_17225 [bacterium]|nr:hypothetical protein [bacterium]